MRVNRSESMAVLDESVKIKEIESVNRRESVGEWVNE